MAENRDRSGVVLLHDGGSNYPTWKIQIKMALIKQGVWGFITGTEIEPEEDDVAALRKFYDRSDKALATIVLAVDPALLYLLGDPQDPAEVWQQLSDQFEKKSWANKLALRRKLYSLRLKENESVQKHIKGMIEIFESLSVVGHVVEEEDRVVHILASLPDSFQMLVTALEASPEVPRLEVVLERLMHEEKKLKEKSEQRSKHPEDALLVRSKPSGGPVCFYCGKNGHIKKFCEEWKKKNEGEEVKSRKDKEESSFFCRRSRVGLDNDSDSDDDIECIALISQVSTVEHRREWIIDSAASHHICNNSNSMQNLKKLNCSQKIKVGNGDFVEVKAEGTVKLEINAGNSTRKFKLQKVLFAPDLKFNLFSVPRAAQAGKTVEFGKQGCRIVESSTRQTIGSGRKKGNLYYVNCVRREERNSNKCKERSLDSKQMQRALHCVSESNFEREMMKRLDRVEREVQSYTLKEDDDQNQEDMNLVQEDRKSGDEIQEDCQDQKKDAIEINVERKESPEVLVIKPTNVDEDQEKTESVADEKDISKVEVVQNEDISVKRENKVKRLKRFFSKFNYKRVCHSRSSK